MKQLALTILIASSAFGLAWADTPAATATATAPAAAKGPSVAETLKQIERDWADAEKAGNPDQVAQYLGDDWVALGYDGKKTTKQSELADLKSGKNKVESVELGPMEVKVLGNVAVVQGSDVEKSTTDGKDTSGKWIWTDVFAKRDGKWVAVRSQSGKLK